MKPEEVQSLLISNLKHTTRLESSGDQTVLRIIFQSLDKDKLMDDLGFDEDAKTWAGALFETIYESDAVGKYKDKFEPYKPSYAGDTGYTGPTEPHPAVEVVARRAAEAPTTPLIFPVHESAHKKQP